uniref:c-Myc-binding protein n=1 Tax=Anopheles dirus TaxID=7168 RepID=A0A182N2C2_9DIPT
MTNYKPIDVSKEDFRKYLVRKGVMDAITKVLIRCHIERPENALEYVLYNLTATYKPMTAELHAANQEIEVLKKELNALKLANETRVKSTNPPDTVVKTEQEIDTTNGDNGDIGGASEEEAVKQENAVVQQETADADERDTEDKAKVAAPEPTTNGVPETAVAPANETAESKEPANTSESK